jgi:hypothetical protein
MITRIEAPRDRCLEKLDVAVGPFQVVIGKICRWFPPEGAAA